MIVMKATATDREIRSLVEHVESAGARAHVSRGSEVGVVGEPLSPAAADAGADGIIVEVHPDSDEAICDGPQALRTEHVAAFAEQVAAIAGRRTAAAAV